MTLPRVELRPQETGRCWAVVLAGGEGRRVSAITRGASGEPAPKQYCSFGKGEPLVARAVRRAAGVVPRERILVVVAQEHRHHWREALSDLPRENIIVQPRNRGTAAGLLLPVLDVLLLRDRDARLLVLPADHHVGSEDVLKEALVRASQERVRLGEALVTMGAATPADILRALAQQQQLSFLTANELPSTPPMLKGLSPKYLRQYLACPIAVEGSTVSATPASAMRPAAPSNFSGVAEASLVTCPIVTRPP